MSEKTWLHWSIYHTCSISIPLVLTMSEKTWLHWSVMIDQVANHVRYSLPCLKRHGSIEAPSACCSSRGRYKSYHVWKDMAPLKHPRGRGGRPHPQQLTMSEKTWLHWSLTPCARPTKPPGPYHVWKDMAPLKPWSSVGSSSITLPYHVWKDMAPLKRFCRSHNLIPIRSLPCLKRHGSIEA